MGPLLLLHLERSQVDGQGLSLDISTHIYAYLHISTHIYTYLHISTAGCLLHRPLPLLPADDPLLPRRDPGGGRGRHLLLSHAQLLQADRGNTSHVRCCGAAK